MPKGPGSAEVPANKDAAALHDERRQWPGKPGASYGPRLYRAIASSFAAGDSIAALSTDYRVPPADVVLAIRQAHRDLLAFAGRIGAACDRHDAVAALCADPSLPRADDDAAEGPTGA